MFGGLNMSNGNQQGLIREIFTSVAGLTLLFSVLVGGLGVGALLGKNLSDSSMDEYKQRIEQKDEKINELSNKNSELGDMIKSQRSTISKLENNLEKQTGFVRDSVSKQQYENIANQVRNSVSVNQYNKVVYEKQELEKILKEKRDCKNELNESKKQLANINQQLLRSNCGNGIYGNCISESQREEFNKQRIFYEKSVGDLHNKCFG